jgi:hypothetical protein
VQPALTCEGPGRSYSAFWVGLGGFAPHARALEQTGTESDCIGGRDVAYAWYELVPAGEVKLRLNVHPGDRMAASVAVTGTRVVLHLRDLSTGRSSQRVLGMRAPDVSSAEWIAEAPSECDEGGHCRTLPLANFGTASFQDAQTRTRAGRTGTVSGRGLSVTALTLQSGGVSLGVAGSAFASASTVEVVPGPLLESGGSFTVTYKRASAPHAFRRVARRPA